MHWYERRYQPYPSDWTGPGRYTGKQVGVLLGSNSDSWTRGARIGSIINEYSKNFESGKYDSTRAIAAKRMRSDIDTISRGIAGKAGHLETLKAMSSVDPYGQFRTKSYKDEMKDTLQRLQDSQYEQRVLRTAYSELKHPVGYQDETIKRTFRPHESLQYATDTQRAIKADKERSISEGKREIDKILKSKASSYPICDYENLIYEMSRIANSR